MEEHVNVTVTTEQQCCNDKSTRAVDARRQIFSGATAGERVTVNLLVIRLV